VKFEQVNMVSFIFKLSETIRAKSYLINKTHSFSRKRIKQKQYLKNGKLKNSIRNYELDTTRLTVHTNGFPKNIILKVSKPILYIFLFFWWKTDSTDIPQLDLHYHMIHTHTHTHLYIYI